MDLNSENYIVDTTIVDGDPLSSVVIKETEQIQPPKPGEPVNQVEPEISEQVDVVEQPEVEPEVKPEQPGEAIDAEDESGQLEVEEGDPSKEEQEEPNPFFFLGQQLKKEGFLKEDLEVSEQAQGHEIYDAYKVKLREDLEPQIRQEVYTQLQNEGINANDILVAQAIRNGTDYRLLNEITMHEKFATIGAQATPQEKVEAVKYMYLSRGFSNDEIDKIIQKDEESDEITGLNELFEQAHTFHKTKFDDFKVNQQKAFEQQQELERQQVQESEKLVKQVLSSKKIMDDPLSEEQVKQLRDSIYSPTAIVEVDGVKYNTTELKSFMYEFERNQELKLWLFKKYKFREQDSEVLKNEVKREVEDDFLSAYEIQKRTVTKKDKQKPVIHSNKEPEKEAKDSGFILDFSGPSVKRVDL